MGQSPTRPSTAWWLTGLLLPPLIWAGLALYYYSAFITHPSHGVVGGPDGILYGWYFESIEHALANGQNPFVSPGMNAPVGVNLMWNTSLFLPAVIFAPLTAWFGGLAVSGWLMVAAPVLSAATTYFVLRRLTGSVLGPAVVATLFGFGPYFVGHAGHLNLILGAPVLPLFLLLGYRLLVDQRGSAVRIGIGLGLTVAAGMLISEEVVAIGLISVICAVVAGVIVERGQARERVRFASRGTAVGAGVAVVVLAVPLYYQFLGPLALHHGVDQGNQPLDLAGLIRPSSLQYYARASDVATNNRYYANGVENTGYLGLPLIALVIAVVIWLVRRRDRFALWWALAAGAALILSFGTRLWVDGHLTKVPLPWYVIKQLPLVHSLITVRISAVIALLIALLLAYGLTKLPPGRAFAAGVAVIVLCLIPLRPSHVGTYNEIDHITTPRFFTTSAVRAIEPGSTALVLPQGDGPFFSQYPMYWQIQAKMRFNIVGGYSVFNNHGKSTYVSPLPAVAQTLIAVTASGVAPSAAQVDAAKASVPASTIRYVVVTNQTPNVDAVAAAAAEITGCALQRVSDVVLCEVPRS